MKVKALILTAVMLFMTSAVYAAKISPEESMQKLCNAFLHLDEADLKFFKTSTEELHGQYTDSFVNHSKGDAIKFTNAQASRITDALFEQMRQKIKYSVKTESLQGDKAVVAVTITGIEFNKTLNEINFDATGLTAEELSEVMTKEILAKIKNVPAAKTVTIKFNCTYDEKSGLWIPEGGGTNNLSPLFDAALN